MLPDKIHFGVIVKGHVAEMHEMPFPEVGHRRTSLSNWLPRTFVPPTISSGWACATIQGSPMASGHECAGVIVAMGDEVFGSTSKSAMQVATMHPFCGMCDSCRQGHTGDCQQRRRLTAAPARMATTAVAKRFAELRGSGSEADPFRSTMTSPAAEAGFLEPVATVVQGAPQGWRPADAGCCRYRRRHDGPGRRSGMRKRFGARVIDLRYFSEEDRSRSGNGRRRCRRGRASDPVEAATGLTNGKGADIVIAAVGCSYRLQQTAG